MARFNTLADLRGYIAAAVPDLDLSSLQELIYEALMTIDSKQQLNKIRREIALEILKGYQDRMDLTPTGTMPASNLTFFDTLEEFEEYILDTYIPVKTVQAVSEIVDIHWYGSTEQLLVILVKSYRQYISSTSNE